MVTTLYDDPVTRVQAISIPLGIICSPFSESFAVWGSCTAPSALALVAQAILPSIPTIH